MLERYCDILVIGNELPGLVTAAFLAKRGLSVQIIDSDLYSENPKMPDPVCLTNLHSKLLRSILGRLNVPELTIQNFLNHDSNLQFIFPKRRIDVLGNPLTYFEEVEREFPECYAQIKEFYETQARLRHQFDVNELFQKLVPQGFRERRDFKKFIKAQNLDSKDAEFGKLCDLDKQLSQFLKAQVLLAYQSEVATPFAYHIAELFNPGDGEIFSVHDGQAALKKMLKDRITHHDGAVRSRTQINALLFRNGVFEGVEMDDENGSVLSKYIIWNDSLERLGKLMPKKWRFRKIRKFCNQVTHDWHWFSVQFSLEANFVPDPMKSNVVMIGDENAALTHANFLYLQIKKPKMEERALVDVNFLLPSEALSQDVAYFDPYIDEIKNKLIDIMPFCDKSLKLEFPTKPQEQPTDTLFPLNENDYELFKHSAKLNGICNISEKSFYDLFKLNYRTAAPNFYISHPAVFAPFGIESKLILGLKVTDLIWQEVEKVKKRAMKSERRIA